jgi:hypothetical protein
MQHTHGDGVDIIFASLNTSCTLDIAITFVAQTNHFSSLLTTRNNTKPWNLVHTICPQFQNVFCPFKSALARPYRPVPACLERSPRLAPHPRGPRFSTRAQPGCLSRATGAVPCNQSAVKQRGSGTRRRHKGATKSALHPPLRPSFP